VARLHCRSRQTVSASPGRSGEELGPGRAADEDTAVSTSMASSEVGCVPPRCADESCEWVVRRVVMKLMDALLYEAV